MGREDTRIRRSLQYAIPRRCLCFPPRASTLVISTVEKIFAIVKQMEADGVVGRYAIGGAIGAIFWLEPFTTKGVDVFVSWPASTGDPR